MKRLLSALMAFGLLGAATAAPAACHWFGTQLECDLGGRQLLIGTQTAADPSDATGLRPQPFSGLDGLFGGRAVSEWPLRLEIQNVGTDPGLCRKFGNETYCY